MFWGLIMEPQRRYTQKVKKSFHISMASLDILTSTDEPAQLMCGFEGRNYLLCTLRKPDLLQCALDLNFEVGDELSLAANGKCHVHLSGYLTEDFNEEDDENEVEEDVEEEEEVEEKQKKSKRNKKEVQNGPPTKKSKVSNSDDESDTDIKAFLQKSLAETDEDDITFTSDDEAVEEEEDDDEESEDLEEEEEEEEADSSLSEGDSDEKEVEESPKQKSKKNKLNGVPNKQVKQDQVTPKQKEKEKHKKKDQKEIQSPQKDQSPSTKKKTLQGGVLIEDIREGQGPPAKPGKYINVFYEGRLKQNNKLFDSTTKGKGFSFRLGGGEVIKGWDVGVAGMKVGGKRRITCPPSMAYGPKGSPPAIPGNSILVFEVELNKVL